MLISLRKTKFIKILLENSLFLIFGAIAGLVWANVDHASYENLLHFPLIENPWIGTPHGDARMIDLHFLVNDFLMVLFFAIAGKEVWEATLPGGTLNKWREAALPLLASLGGIVMPAMVYLGGTMLTGNTEQFGNGWAIPCATDIAFSYMVARFIFGAMHPAIPFLLLLAIADDAAGLLILAVFYPQGEVQVLWLGLAVVGVLVGLALRRLQIRSFWPYLLIAGPLSWLGFALAGIHPALGLLPIIPTMPHAQMDTGLFDWNDLDTTDTLNAFEHWWKNPVELILGFFGLLNAGVVLSAIGEPTYLVLAGLFLGKPLGIWGFGMFGARVLKLGMPGGMNARELFVVSCAAAIGFTVALFVATVAFPKGDIQDAAKMGALLSFAGAFLTWLAAKLLGVKPREGDDSATLPR